MRVYVELARTAFRQQFAYRAATLAGIFTNSIFGIMLASIFLAFFRSQGNDEVATWTRDQTVTLIWINQSLLMTSPLIMKMCSVTVMSLTTSKRLAPQLADGCASAPSIAQPFVPS